jgi:hypothetical protein
MMKKYGCLVVVLLVTHGTVLSMLHTKKIMSGVSRLKLNRRAFYDLAFDGKVKDSSSKTGLQHLEDAAVLRNQSLEDIKKELRDIKSKLAKCDQLPQIRQEPLLDVNDKWAIRQAHIDSIYKVAQIEAMCKILVMPNLKRLDRDDLLDEVKRIVHE